MGVITTGATYMMQRSFYDTNRDTVQRVMHALMDARVWLKAPVNRATALEIYKRYIQFDDPLVLDLYYHFYIQPISLISYNQFNELRGFGSYLPDGVQILRKPKTRGIRRLQFFAQCRASAAVGLLRLAPTNKENP